jgi:hypothetical protein
VLVFSAIRETRAAQFDIFKSAPVRRQLQQAKLKSVDASHTRKLKLLRKQFVSETGRIDSVDPMLRHDAYSPEGWPLNAAILIMLSRIFVIWLITNQTQSA